MSRLLLVIVLAAFTGSFADPAGVRAAAGDAGAAETAVGHPCRPADPTVCGPNAFCKLPVGGCESPGTLGTCMPIPQVCPDVWDPVCGCDDQTYANECDAGAAGVSVAYRGECRRFCGGPNGIPCDIGEFCKLDIGDCCGDAEGICSPVPQGCPAVWDPVCGCDGVTYGNRCEADAARASVAHPGPCEEPVCCDPALEPGTHGNPFCFEGATCCADGVWRCNDAGANSTCDRDGEVCPQCCDPALEPGTHGNPFCFEGHTCCADGQWHCNQADGTPVCNRPSEACPQCCDPLQEPGTHGNPFCIEGATCCADGTWHCNDAGGNSTCVRDGEVCPQCCDPAFEPGTHGNPLCVEGHSCCADGRWHCNQADGTPVCNRPSEACPQCCDPLQEPGTHGNPFCVEGATCCADGTWRCNDAGGNSTCDRDGEVCPQCCDPRQEPGQFGNPLCFEGHTCCADGQWHCNHVDGTPSCDPVSEVCPNVCGGIAGVPCADGEFCKLPDGECCCDIQGVCVPIPRLCPLVFDPVCGCDGVTYGNECEASAAGVSIDHRGACERVCGGIAGIPCAAGEFCKLPDGQCCCDFQGVCTPIPDACPDVWDPVCGCDGVTYGNKCEADAAGISINHRGPCERVCGNLAGVPTVACETGEFCKHREGDCDEIRPGVCAPIPSGCPRVYDPVCGCDGVTYGNECEADRAGVTIKHRGPCERLCGNTSGGSVAPCEIGEFCQFVEGDCGDGRPGVCTPIPDACPRVYDPVCGCDGTTYGNACEAAMAGVSVDHPGPCDRVCGGIAGIPCGAREYCKFPDGQCCCDIQGVCMPIPDACPAVWDPVCGCDGVTYGNACEAAAAGVSIDHPGRCERICGNILGAPTIPCEANEFCKFPDGDCAGAGPGVCTPMPDVCPLYFNPVCGCDGVTYGNECEANAAGVSIDHAGPCETVCGGIAGIPCDVGEFCKLPDGECCCDVQGVCRPIPQACPKIWDPVCGCDGVTYGNACEADAAEVSIDHRGPCRPFLVNVCPSLGAFAKPDFYISPRSKHIPLDSVEIKVSEKVRLVRACTKTSCGRAPEVVALEPLGPDGVHRVKFSGPIRVGEWTAVTLFVENARGGRAKLCFHLAQLPDDVDQNAQVSLRDATWFGSLFPWGPVKLLDLNGDGQNSLADATKFGQIWNGVSGEGRRRNGTRPWRGAGLPDKPACGCR